MVAGTIAEPDMPCSTGRNSGAMLAKVAVALACGRQYSPGMITTETIPHIRQDANCVAWIDDTNVKVVEVVLDQIAYGHSPEEIHFQHPHLSLAQVHAALAFYYDHQADLEADIARRYEMAEVLRAQAKASPLQQRFQGLARKP